jgi:hypothetical protein
MLGTSSKTSIPSFIESGWKDKSASSELDGDLEAMALPAD